MARPTLNNRKRSGYDVTGCVNLKNVECIKDAGRVLFNALFPRASFKFLNDAFDYCHSLYHGKLPDYHAAETPYHDYQHVMDVTLATMRLIDGYEKSRDGAPSLGQRRVTLAVLSALFHDSGYIRHRQDKVHKNGAEYTKTHVTRSTHYLKQYLLGTRLEEGIPFVTRLIHYTGYEIPLDKVAFDDPDDNRVGWILGTADLIAQMSDRMYLEKCRDYLFLEFELGGVLTRTKPDGEQEVVYSSPDELLAATPDFIRNTVENRLKKSFHEVYSYAAVHFGGPNLYMEALENNCRFLENLVAKDQLHLLRRNPSEGPN